MIESVDILYPVEKIVDKRTRKGKVEYLVRWKNYNSDTDSWEPSVSLKESCHTLIKAFNENLRSLNNQNCSSNVNNTLHQKSSENISMESVNADLSEKKSVKNQKFKNQKSNSLLTKTNNELNGSLKPIRCSDKTLTKSICENLSIAKPLETDIKGKSKTTKKSVLYLEDNEIDETPSHKSSSLKLKSISSEDFSPNSISTLYSDQNHKIPSPRTTFNSMLTEKTINHIEEQSKSNELKRKLSTIPIENGKKLKIINKETKSVSESNGNNSIESTIDLVIKADNNITKQTSIKTLNHINGFNIPEIKFDKCLKRLPYQRHKDSENVESIDSLAIRRKSARQMGGSNRFREIMVRKDIEAGFTEISLYNKCHSFPNCFTFKILNELSIALKQAINDSSRVILLSSVGKVFSCGLDLDSIINNTTNSFNHLKNSRLSTAQLTNPLSHSQYLQDLVESLKRFLLQLLNFPKPIIVGVNGPAIGLGCAILPLCDLIYATESSSFYLPYSSLSQFPEGGTSVTLSMLIGMPAANQLLLGGRRWSAKEALNRGLISEIIFSDKFKAELFSRCKKLANVSSMSMETMKCMLRFQYKEKIELSINLECKKLLDIWRTSEFQTSAQHFIDKELPDLLS